MPHLRLLLPRLRSTQLQKHVSLYAPIHYAWSYPTGCRPLSLPRSFSVRGPKLEATYPEHYKQSQFDTHCSQRVKDQAYKSPVRPALEYGCTLWDPYRVYQKSRLKQVQHRAERFVTRTYTKEEECVTNALKELNWPTLEKRSQVQLD